VIMNISTVFVIDDQSSIRHALGEMLSIFGYNVETYESADSFLRALDLCGTAVSLPMFACRAWTELSLCASSRAVKSCYP
jgi:DNA-binding NtrC family response regulator